MVQEEQSQERLPIERLPAPAIEFLPVIESGIERGLNKREIQAEIASIREARGERASGIKDTYLTAARRHLEAEPHVNAIREGVRQGLTIRRIQEGVGISREAVEQTVNAIQGKADIRASADQRFTNLDKSADARRLSSSSGPILRRFSYTIEIRDGRNGNVIGHSTVASDRDLEKSEAQNEARKDFISSTGQLRGTKSGDRLLAMMDEDDPPSPDDIEFLLIEVEQASETIL